MLSLIHCHFFILTKLFSLFLSLTHISLSLCLSIFFYDLSFISQPCSESLYNISKVARSSILKFFNVIFDGLCKLFAHVDVDVKNGANLLDRLIKDIVTESDTFDVEGFIPLLQKQIKRTKPYIRQLIVGWILVLNAVPDINMLDYLPEFLDGLFNMLSDCNVRSSRLLTMPFKTS